MKKTVQFPFTAAMATVISVCALGVSLYQAKLSREQQLASVWPYLTVGGVGKADSIQQSWGIQVENNGLGPAIIESVSMQLDGQELPPKVFMDSLYAQNVRMDSVGRMNYHYDEISPGQVVSAGSTLVWWDFELFFKGTPPSKTVFDEFMPRLRLTVVFKSLYNERWTCCLNCQAGVEEVRKLD